MTSEKSVTTINSTVIKAHAGKKVQPTIPRAANDILVTAGEDQNKHMTKGVYANEFIKMAKDEYSDVVDEYEEEIDKQLSEEGIDLVEEVLHTDDELSDYGDTRDVQTGIYFPETFVEQMPAQGKSQLITESVEYYIRTPFLDRHHRIRVKREILQHERGEVETEELSELAMEWIGVDPVQETEEPELESDENEEKHSYGGIYEYREYASEVTETPAARTPYLQEYIDLIGEKLGYTDEIYPQNTAQAKKVAKNLFDCSDDPAENYARGVEIRRQKVQQEQVNEYRNSDEWEKLSQRARDGSVKVNPRMKDVESIREVCSDQSNEYGLAYDHTGTYVLVYDHALVEAVEKFQRVTEKYVKIGEKQIPHYFDENPHPSYRYSSWTDYSDHVSAYSDDELPELLSEFTEKLQEDSFQHDDDVSVQEATDHLFSGKSDDWKAEIAAQAFLVEAPEST